MPSGFVLSGSLVRLEPLSVDHAGDLVAAAAEDRASYGFTSVPDGRAGVDAYLDDMISRANAGEVVAFAQIRLDQSNAVGCTAFLNLRRLPGAETPFAVEIGSTWLGASAQGTGLNVEAKRLLLAHAFGTWAVARVDMKTDARNQRSRQAIAALGAQFEGILRSWQPSLVAGEEGRFRDTAMYSIVAAEWPATEALLDERLGRRAREPEGSSAYGRPVISGGSATTAGGSS